MVEHQQFVFQSLFRLNSILILFKNEWMNLKFIRSKGSKCSLWNQSIFSGIFEQHSFSVDIFLFSSGCHHNESYWRNFTIDKKKKKENRSPSHRRFSLLFLLSLKFFLKSTRCSVPSNDCRVMKVTIKKRFCYLLFQWLIRKISEFTPRCHLEIISIVN